MRGGGLRGNHGFPRSVSPVRGVRFRTAMGFADVWNRTLVYFGIAEEGEWDEDLDGYATEEQLERSYSSRPNVRRLAPRRRDRDYDDWTDSSQDATTVQRPERVPRPRGLEAVPSGNV